MATPGTTQALFWAFKAWSVPVWELELIFYPFDRSSAAEIQQGLVGAERETLSTEIISTKNSREAEECMKGSEQMPHTGMSLDKSSVHACVTALLDPQSFDYFVWFLDGSNAFKRSLDFAIEVQCKYKVYIHAQSLKKMWVVSCFLFVTFENECWKSAAVLMFCYCYRRLLIWLK